MNTKANDILNKIRATLEQNLGNDNLAESEGSLTEAEQKFCEDGLAFIAAAAYTLEGFDGGCTPEDIVDALESIAEDDESLSEKVAQFFELHGVTIEETDEAA